MKLSSFALCGAMCVLPVAFAAPGTQQQKRFGDGACLPAYLSQYDVNDDGVIDEEERQTMEQARDQIKKQLRDKWDADGDGKVCDQERDQAKLQLREMIKQNRLERFTEADLDEDGMLSYDEFVALPGMAKKVEDSPELVAAIFDRLDADDDGFVTEEEFLAAVQQCDRDRDGSGDGSGGGGTGGDGTGGGGGGK